MKISEGDFTLNGRKKLLEHFDKIHTTPMGEQRIKNNLSLEVEDVVGWCRDRVKDENCRIRRSGKNLYVESEDCLITINASSYTIITAHKNKKSSSKK